MVCSHDGAGDARRLLERGIDLPERGVGAAHRERHEAGDVGHQQDPDRAVEHERRPDEGQKDADRHDRAGQAQRQDREIVQQAPAAHAGAQVDIGDREAEQHRDQRGAGRELEAVDDAAHRDLVVEQGRRKWREREVVGRGRRDPALAEGSSRQHRDRGHRAEEHDQQAEGEQRPLHRAELHALRAHPAAADRDERAALEIAALHDEARDRQQHQDERERGGIAPARRIAAEQPVDPGRQEDDLGGQAQERLRPEQRHRIDRREQRAAGDRGRHERQRDAARHRPAPGAQHLGGLLEGGIDRLQCGVGQEIGEGEDMDADDEDDPAHAEDVERPRSPAPAASAAPG